MPLQHQFLGPNNSSPLFDVGFGTNEFVVPRLIWDDSVFG